MKKMLTILATEEKTGVTKKGQPYRMVICQCVVQGEKVQVGELSVFDPQFPIAPGQYDAEFDIDVDYQTKKIGSRLVSLVSVKGSVSATQWVDSVTKPTAKATA